MCRGKSGYGLLALKKPEFHGTSPGRHIMRSSALIFNLLAQVMA
ncbi:MAG: hypothetical protein WD425_18400 [Nitrospirales bacterium]